MAEFNWFEAVRGMKERHDREYQNGKIADSIVKTNPEILEHLGMSDTQFYGQSAKDKAASIQGVLEGVGYKKATADIKKQMMDLNLLSEKYNAFKKDQAAEAGFADDLRTRLDGASEPEPGGNIDSEGGGAAPVMSTGGGKAMPSDQELFTMALKRGVNLRSGLDLARALKAVGAKEFTPGSIMPTSNPDYDYGVASASGAGTFLPKGGRGSAGRSATQEALDEARTRDLQEKPDREFVGSQMSGLNKRMEEINKQLDAERLKMPSLDATGSKYQQAQERVLYLSKERSRVQKAQDALRNRSRQEASGGGDGGVDWAEAGRIKAAFKAGKMTREEAKAALKKAGIQ